MRHLSRSFVERDILAQVLCQYRSFLLPSPLTRASRALAEVRRDCLSFVLAAQASTTHSLRR